MAILTIAVAGCTSEESGGQAARGLPRYALQHGQELHYSGQGSFQYDGVSSDSASDWKIWVTRENSDGSWRLIVRHASVHDSKDASSEEADVTLAYLDLFPDGRFAENPSFGYRFNPHALIARLPADENEARSGWQLRDEASDTIYHYTAKKPESDSSADWKFVRVEESPRNRIYRLTSESEFVFDRREGLMERAHTKSVQKTRNGSGNDHIELKEAVLRDPEWIAALDREMERYVETSAQHKKLSSRLEIATDEAETRLDQAAALWTQLGSEVTSDVVREAVERRIAQDQTFRSRRLEDAEKKARVLGQPAPEWETTDLDGKPHRLADYLGKVVVLDFWYRGCGWCIRAMPQVNQIADEFGDAPVAVLGMNTDAKLEDAQFVENEMQLRYPSLRIDKELPKKYGVSGFPTLVILDQAGTIRDMHVGYSSMLREEVAETIQRLLENPATIAPGGGQEQTP